MSDNPTSNDNTCTAPSSAGNPIEPGRLTNSVLLVPPDDVGRPLTALPASRSEAIDLIKRVWVGIGPYTFTREVLDPDVGELLLVEMVLTAYAEGEYGLTELAPGNRVAATTEDITRYLTAVTRDRAESVLTLSLNTYEDKPDCQGAYAWLRLEDDTGEMVAEIGLTVRQQLRLSRESESPNDPVYVCEFPTLRSIFRFVQIACDTFRCDGVSLRSCPLNLRSVDWFA